MRRWRAVVCVLILMFAGWQYHMRAAFLRSARPPVARADILRRFPLGGPTGPLLDWLALQGFHCSAPELVANPRIGFAIIRGDPLWAANDAYGVTSDIGSEPKLVRQIGCAEAWWRGKFMYTWYVNVLLDDREMVFDVGTDYLYGGL